MKIRSLIALFSVTLSISYQILAFPIQASRWVNPESKQVFKVIGDRHFSDNSIEPAFLKYYMDLRKIKDTSVFLVEGTPENYRNSVELARIKELCQRFDMPLPTYSILDLTDKLRTSFGTAHKLNRLVDYRNLALSVLEIIQAQKQMSDGSFVSAKAELAKQPAIDFKSEIKVAAMFAEVEGILAKARAANNSLINRAAAAFILDDIDLIEEDFEVIKENANSYQHDLDISKYLDMVKDDEELIARIQTLCIEIADPMMLIEAATAIEGKAKETIFLGGYHHADKISRFISLFSFHLEENTRSVDRTALQLGALINVLQVGGRCDKCGKYFAKVLDCSACKSVKYCSKDCQKKAWGSHKGPCKEMQMSKKDDKL